MTPQDGASAWLGLSLQDWTNIATIFGAIGTFIVAIAALVVSVSALRTQREALPVSVEFRVVMRKGPLNPLKSGQDYLMAVELKNTGVRAYLRNVYVAGYSPKHLLEDAASRFAVLVAKGDSLPEDLDSMRKKGAKLTRGMFLSQYILPGQSVKLFLIVPRALREIKLTAVLSVRRGEKEGVRLLSSDHLLV